MESPEHCESFSFLHDSISQPTTVMPSSNIRSPDDMDAWVLGSGIPSLAAAVHLIEEAKVPPNRIHIIENVRMAGGSTVNAGDPVNGYEYRAGVMSAFNDASLENLLSIVPSKTRSGRTALDDILEFNEANPLEGRLHTRFLVEKSNRISRIDPKHVSLGLRDRMELFRLAGKTEKSLGRTRIREYFSESFFRGNYWLMLATMFGFQPWHSAAEFQRLSKRFLHNGVHKLNDPRPLDRGRFNHHETITVPIAQFLESRGVDFRFNTTVVDIIMDPPTECHRVSAIQCVKADEPKTTITLAENDIVIVSLGSSISGSTTGTNTTSPPLDLMEIKGDLDENWLLWLELCTKHPKLGNAYNFCTRMPESRLETFTVTLKSPEFFNQFTALTGDQPGTAAFVTLKDSSWLLSASLPQQPLFQDQPSDVQVFWGHAMHPDKEGDFIKKPMVNCSGNEIMAELLHHLKFPVETIIHNSITIPCVLPRMTAMLLPRTTSDRPQIIPEGMKNVALIGHFVEIPDEVVATTDYGVKTAQMAVRQLMGLQDLGKNDKE